MAQTIIVDTTPGFRQPTVYYSQGDVGRTFDVDLRSRFGDSLPASPTITIQATKPSGLGFSVAATSISNSVATFTLTDTMTNEAGRFPAEIKVVKNSVTLYTANFYIQCEESAHPEGTTDGDLDSILPKYVSVTVTTLAAGSSATYTYDPATNTATFGIPQGAKGADGTLSSNVIAAAYDASATYEVGDFSFYNGSLYRCTTEISTAEAWTAGHWSVVTVTDEITDLKDDIDTITEETTSEGFDENDNLVEGLTLSSNYYPNGDNTPYSNSNFSYLGIDITGITKLKINGTHHIYTVTQFPAMGVFLDSNDAWVADVRDQTVDLSSFPIVVNVPDNATKLYLNTDYKASDYPSSLPSGLYVYPWRTNVVAIKVPYSALEKTPVALSDLSDGSKKLKIVAGVIRNDGNGWAYINDSGHEPLNLSAVSVDANGRIQIDYDFTATKVLSLVATPDETFARLYTIGGSVGLTNTLFNVYTLPKTYGGMVRVTSGVFDATSYASFSSVAVQANGEIRLYHTSLSGISSKEIFNIQASSPSYSIILGSQGFDYISLYAYDANGQKITDFTGLSFDIYATRAVNAVMVDANDIVDAGGNFWIYGVMEL